MSIKRQLRLDILTLVAFLPVALAILIWLLQLAGSNPIPSDKYRVQAIVPTSVELAPAAEVRMAGVEVGRVARLAEHDKNTLLLLDLDPEHAPVFRNARVHIRLRSLIGENYVELEPGKPSAGELSDGGTLTADRAAPYTASDQVLSTFDAERRRQMRGQLRALGGALTNRGDDLNRTLGAASSLTAESSPVAATLAAQRRQVAALIDDAGRVMRALGERGADIRLLARRSRTALAALGKRDEFVKRALRELPTTLAQARTSATKLSAFSDASTPVLRDLRISLEGLPPVVQDLSPAAASTRETMEALEMFAQQGTPTLSSLEDFSATGVKAIPPLRSLLSEYNPFVAYVSRYSRELGAFFANMRSLASARDATGRLARINPLVSGSTHAAFTPEMEDVYQRLRGIGALRETVGPHFVNPYPPPGEIADPEPFEGEYPRIKAER